MAVEISWHEMLKPGGIKAGLRLFLFSGDNRTGLGEPEKFEPGSPSVSQ